MINVLVSRTCEMFGVVSSRFVVLWFECLVGCIEVTFFSLLLLILIFTVPEGTLYKACILIQQFLFLQM